MRADDDAEPVGATVAEAWDVGRFRDKYRHWVEQVQVGEVRFKEPL